MDDWHQHWFNEDYLALYAHHDAKEAEEQVAFVLEATGLRSGRVLDLGCGVGRHAIPLAEAGFEVTGVDGSKTLIAEAKKLSRAVRWVHADFFDLQGLGRFDLVLSMFTSFGYFDDARNQKVLDIVSQSLNPNGYFFLDFLDPAHVAASLLPEEVQHVDGQEIKITRKLENGRIIKTIAFPGRTYQESVRLYTRPEIEAMATRSGLKLLRFWTGYNAQTTDRQLFLFKA